MRKLTCQEVLDQLADYLDADAQEELIAQVDLHIGSCVHCQVEVDSLRRTITLYRCEQRVMLPAHLDERLRMALEQAYRDGIRDGARDDDPGRGEA